MFGRKTMISLYIVFALIVVTVAATSWHFIFGTPNPPLPRVDVTVASSTDPSASTASSSASTTTTTVLGADQLSIDGGVFDIEVASTILQQARGLSNRASLGDHAGMLFIFSSEGVQTFWMKDMNFPLDMIWISGNTVVGFVENAPAEPGVAFPTTIYSSPSNTDKVLEVNAGTVARYHIAIGDTVTIGPIK